MFGDIFFLLILAMCSERFINQRKKQSPIKDFEEFQKRNDQFAHKVYRSLIRLIHRDNRKEK